MIVLKFLKTNSYPTITIIQLALALILLSCEQEKSSMNNEAIKKLVEFKNKEKFTQDMNLLYPGASNPEIKNLLTVTINQSADDFINIINLNDDKVSQEQYKKLIETGLNRFKKIYSLIDTEDRERICYYYEEIMDIVKLESSDGLLNNFLYGFNPAKSSNNKHKIENK